MRLIDADALKERLLGYKVPDEPIANQAHKELIYAIDSLPTVCDIEQIRAEIEEYKSTIDNAISEDELKIEGMQEAYNDCLEVIDKYTK